MIPYPTVTKAQLLKLLADQPDEAEVFVHMKIADAVKAIESAKAGSHDELFLPLRDERITEARGISLVAYLR